MVRVKTVLDFENVNISKREKQNGLFIHLPLPMGLQRRNLPISQFYTTFQRAKTFFGGRFIVFTSSAELCAKVWRRSLWRDCRLEG